MNRLSRLLLLFAFIGLLVPTNTHAATYTFQKVVDGFKSPVAIVQAPHDDQRLFVPELAGKVRLVKDSQLLAQPFLDLSAIVSTQIFGQGLLDIVFHLDYAQNGYFYVLYSDLDGDPVLARYSVSATDPDQADPSSAKILLIIPHPGGFHYGGQLAFGKDGYLYYSTGDGGSKVDEDGNAQNTKSLLGALLRMDVDHGDPYAIPADNPYGKDSELWAKGLRNVWRFSFDSATGDLYLPDVGENVYEEINYQPADDKGGENYGWNHYEGTHDILGGSKTGLIFPVMEYAHVENNCAIVGGYVYHGSALPDLVGQYIFADYCSGRVWALTHDKAWKMSFLMQTRLNITSFGQDNQGELYAADFGTNAIYKLGAIK